MTGKAPYKSSELLYENRTSTLLDPCVDAALRIPAGEIEQLVTSRVRQFLLDPGSGGDHINAVLAAASRNCGFSCVDWPGCCTR